jgi:hypothetical protein
MQRFFYENNEQIKFQLVTTLTLKLNSIKLHSKISFNNIIDGVLNYYFL